MSDIFISYASGDREHAKMLAETLVRRGWSVWWDRTIPPGQEYDKVIESALDSAKCVVVLWSTASVASSWVKTEAAEAMRRKILVPALIDHLTIPLEFRRLQAADLSHWRGDPDHAEWKKFLDSIAATIQEPLPPLPPPPAPLPPGRWKRATWPAIAVTGALAGVGLGLMLSRSQPANTPGPGDPLQNPTVVVDPPPPPPPPQPNPTPPDPPPVVNPSGSNPTVPTSRPPVVRPPKAAKPPEPGPAPSPVEPVTRPSPEPPTPPLAATNLPTATAAPKLANREFEEILLLATIDGEVEELEATLVFGDTGLLLRDEDAKILRTVPYSSVQKATYSRTQRRIMFVRTTRHQLILGTGGEEVVLRLPDATSQTILYQLEQHTGVKVAH